MSTESISDRRPFQFSLRSVLILIFISSLALAWLGLRMRRNAVDVSPLVGKTAPDMECPLLDGSTFNLKSKRGKQIVMIDFWATWCGPCVAEMPIIAKVADEYRHKNVALYCVNEGQSADEIHRFLEGQGMDVAVCLDMDYAAGRSYGAESIPMLVLVDLKGIVRNVHIGYSPDIDAKLKQELDAILRTGDIE